MRRTYRWDKITQKMVEIRRDSWDSPAVTNIAPDIQPYKSMVDGSMITSRSQHRAHLRQHGKQELGNEMPELTAPRHEPDRGEIRNDIREARRQIEWGEAPSGDRLRSESVRLMREMGLGD